MSSSSSTIHKTFIRLSSSSSDTSIKAPILPNRMTVAYNKMKEVCPDAIRLYATCVVNHQNLGSLEKECCAAEFAAVKDCFRSVRR